MNVLFVSHHMEVLQECVCVCGWVLLRVKKAQSIDILSFYTYTQSQVFLLYNTEGRYLKAKVHNGVPYTPLKVQLRLQ